MDKPLPFVSAALFCERVLTEKDETLTLVRVTDKLLYRIEGEGWPEGVRPLIPIQGLLSLKSGSVTGDHTLVVIGEKPSGQRKQILSLPITLLGKEHGQNVILKLNIVADEDGLYWFDVFFDEQLLTRIPLMVTPLPKQESEGPGSR